MLRTAQQLARHGHEVEVFAMSWQGETPPGIRVHLLPQRGWLNYQRYQKFIDAAFAHMRQHPFDYVVGYNRMAGLDAHFAADPCFIERAHKQRNFWYRLLPRFKWFASCEQVIFSAESRTEILMVALTEKPVFQHWYGTQDTRFHYIPPFLSAERFQSQDRTGMRAYLRQAFQFGADDFVYMLTGSGFHMKGLDRAIIALAALPPDILANTRIIAVGQDNPHDFEKLAAKLGVTDHVIISKGRTDIPQLMQGADICIHPARRENTGLVILEGMACGTPMLVTDTCGYAHYVDEANAGIVCHSPYDQAQFNVLFQTMRLNDAAANAEWGKNGWQKAQQLMQENDGSAEAKILIRLARQKKARIAQTA
ncbi:glycosyltransferase family 4 protein [Methylophilus rhizosphaerae]|nr:glycosyltransferase family 4 protein [Methylophilus rhizosphaerae]